MTEATHEPDAQEFVSSVCDELESRGYSAVASLLRSEMPDSDVTSMGGLGAEKVAETIATQVFNDVYSHVAEVLREPASPEIERFLSVG